MPARVILDTDFRSDVDDVGALAVLNALADAGECSLAGVIASLPGPAVVGAINAVNTWYGRGFIPIGISRIDENSSEKDPYAPAISDPDRYPSTQNRKTAPDSTWLYRRLLHESPDRSVKIVSIGGQTCLRLLLESGANMEGDGSINRPGIELVQAKVSCLCLMAGNFADGEYREHNINFDLEASQKVAANWPTRMVYSGYEFGRVVKTGGRLTDPEHNPVARAYEIYPVSNAGVITDSPSYDQTIVYHAVRGGVSGGVRLWRESEPGEASFPEGRTVFTRARSGRCRYLIPEAPPEVIAGVIEALMVQPRGMAGT